VKGGANVTTEDMESPAGAGAPAGAEVALGIVRQQQIYAFAVVMGDGREQSLLLSRPLAARQPLLLNGDLVAVQHDRIAAHWPRALVLRAMPDGVRLRLASGAQAIAQPGPACALSAPWRTGDPVFSDGQEILARAWSWYEPEVPAPALLARVALLLRESGPASP